MLDADVRDLPGLLVETIRKARGKGQHLAVSERMPTHHAIRHISSASSGFEATLWPAFSNKRAALLVVLVSFPIMS